MIPFEIERAVVDLCHRYAQCLDDDRLEEWPEFFVEDGRYLIHPRENVAAGLDGYWLYFDNRKMLRDRIVSLRKANVYNIHQDRHLVSNIRVEQDGGGELRVRSNYLVIQSDVEGRSRVFSAGEYRDRVVMSGAHPLFKERVVIPDTFNVEGLVAVPL